MGNGKSIHQSAPCAAIRAIKDVGYPSAGGITLTVNGQPKQTGDLSQMIWNVPEIIANLSRQYELVPGDLIFTGTPAGVGPVVPGPNILTGKIEGVGALQIEIASRRK